MLKTIKIESFAGFEEEMKAAFEDHFNTCESNKAAEGKFEVDIDLMQSFIDQGVLNLFAAVDDQDVIVGYVGVVIAMSHLMKDKVEATIEYLYVLPEERRKGLAEQMVEAAEQSLKEAGIDWLTIALPDKEYSDLFADKLGYKKCSMFYNKKL